MSTIEVKVPDIGDFKDVAVIELLVKPGDRVALDQSLITVESDKASMEIPSQAAGIVREIKVAIGDRVNEGTLLALMEAETGTSPAVAESKQPVASASSSQNATNVGVFSAPAAPAAGATASAAAGPATQEVEVRLPDIGDFKDVAVIEVFVKPGDAIKLEQSLFTVESDKASMEIPSSHAGTLKALKVKVGDKVNVGDLIALLETEGAGPGAAPAATATATSAPAPAAPAVAGVAAMAAPVAVPAAVPAAAGSAPALPAHNPTAVVTSALPHASPSVRKFARELGVPLDEIKGSGPKGRVTQDDVQAFTKAVMAGVAQTRAQTAKDAAKEGANAPGAAAGGAADGAALGLLPWPKVDFAKFGAIERKALPRIKKISGANLHRNWVMIPHVTNHDEADITDLEAFRVSTNKDNEKSGVKVTMLAFLIKACVAALKKFPEFNSSLDGEELVYKSYWNIGFAADTPNGLVVPVIKNADQKGILAISQEMNELAKKARDGKLGPADMSGATFTISSLGGIGGTYFTPIINAPEVAILGVCRSETKPRWNGSTFEPRLMLPLSLSWDHRVIDGAGAARFNAYLGQILADFRRVLL